MTQSSHRRGPLQNVVVDTLFVVAAFGFMLGQPVGRWQRSVPAPDQNSRRDPLLKLSLDDATANELGLLPQIGPKMAERIVRFRNSRPGIGSWADVESISGMGPSTIQTIRPWCTIAPLAEDLASNH